MGQTFFWYDLETTGVNPREDRVMQFAGQRTGLDLKPIGEPVNVFVKLSDDILPEPDAIFITGITPQQTIADGLTEAEFMRLFYDEIATPGTIFVGFNTVRFDDEFMRFMNYRNFYDAYAWQWKDDRSRWDLLDVVRMTRALRPEGINWPVVDGKPTNRLELLTKENGLDHEHAHDALNDVLASIAVADLIRTKQPKLFDWLLKTREKSQVAAVAQTQEPFVYTSGKYAAEYEKTTVVIQLAPHPKKAGSLVYDLRHDPTPFFSLTAEELAERWRWTRDTDAPPRLPVKTMQFNRCPAVAPLGVLDAASQQRIGIDLKQIARHKALLLQHPEFVDAVLGALQILDAEQAGRQKQYDTPVDGQLYAGGFFDTHDTNLLGVVRAAEPQDLTVELSESFHDPRLRALLPLYKARNYPRQLSDEDRAAWESHRHHTLLDGGVDSRLARYMHRLSELAQSPLTDDQKFLVEELQLYAESIMPLMDDPEV